MRYEKFKLKCSHYGNIIWRSSDGGTMGVRGTKRSCDVCFKNSSGERTPTVYTIRTSKKLGEGIGVSCPHCLTALEDYSKLKGGGWCPKCLEWWPPEMVEELKNIEKKKSLER